MRPTIAQRVFADLWPTRIVVAGGTAGTVAWCAWTLAAVLEPTAWSIAWFSLMVVLSGVLGLLGSFLAAVLFLPPLYHARALLNGAPYAVGERVRILCGAHRGRVARVSEVWAERHEVRVELGAKEREAVEDVFSYVEVCREPPPPTRQHAACGGNTSEGASAA